MDSGPLYAYVDADDRHPQASLELLQTHPGPLIVPTLVVTEVVDLLATRLGVDPEVRFLGDLASGEAPLSRCCPIGFRGPRVQAAAHLYQDPRDQN